MKKFWVMIGTGLLLTCLAGCGGDAGESGSQSGSQGSGAAGSGQQSSEPAGSQGQDSNPEGDQESGTVANGYDYANGWTEEMAAVRKAVGDAMGEDYWPSMQLTPDLLEMNFGLTEDMYEDYMAEMPMISAHVDTLVVVKPKAGQEAAVEEKLNAYRDAKINDTMQYPMNLGKLQASRVEVVGDYICFVQLGADTTDALDEGDEAVIVQCQKANEQALDAIRALVEK